MTIIANNKTPWAQNDKLFLKELKEGYNWQKIPALFFELNGFKVEMPSLEIRKSIDEAKDWINSVDLIVNGFAFEVKSRNKFFTSPESFQYESIFIDTVSGFLAKDPKPLAYIMISRQTGCMAWIPTKDYEDNWIITRKKDRVRNINESFFVAKKEEMKSMDSLISLIKNKKD